ncbi:MAG TPA: hypothetical protein VEA80_16725 [Vitreimonas sp.]|uniref:hypothetical protein n=1 Tax=Vitreimonas sp. TaxID=3069702 RepID=UPI002D68503D|nr:hypothetical protein [Vitreimonas sp.]HYD89124.1 hypothetical protein [Vitreimonas sp.]
MRKQGGWAFGVSALACVAPGVAHADLVWPALYAEQRLLSLPVIAAGLLIEISVLRLCFSMQWNAALKAGVLANAVSAAIGFFLIPLAGIAWEVFPGQFINAAFDMGTFNPLAWIATFVLATLVTTAIELVVLWKLALPRSRRLLLIWCIANAATVAIAFLSLASTPMRDIPLFDLWPFE